MPARYSKDEVVIRGKAIYEQKLKAHISSGSEGKWLMIDVDSEDYDIDEDALRASGRVHQRHPGADLYGMRIGQPVPVRIGARITCSDA